MGVGPVAGAGRGAGIGVEIDGIPGIFVNHADITDRAAGVYYPGVLDLVFFYQDFQIDKGEDVFIEGAVLRCSAIHF